MPSLNSFVDNASLVRTWTPTLTPSGAMTFTGTAIALAEYRVVFPYVEYWLAISGTIGGVIGAGSCINFTLPTYIAAITSAREVGPINAPCGAGGGRVGAGIPFGLHVLLNATLDGTANLFKDGANYTAGAQDLRVLGSYRINES